MDKNWLNINFKKVVSFFIFIILYLLFQGFIEELLIRLGSFISNDSIGFKFAYILIFLLISIYYVNKIQSKYIPNPDATFSIILVLCYYILFRISNTNILLPKFDGLKYLDIIWYIALLHLILLFVNRKNNFKNIVNTSNFFLEDKIHEGEIDNRLVLDELISVISNLKTENSFTIGLNAPWGYGKSTFLNQFFNKYSEKNKDSIIFWYSIWKNKGSTAIIDNFFQILSNELKPFSGEIGSEIDNYVNEILQITPGEFAGILQSGKKLLISEKSTEDYYERIDAIIKKIDRQIIVVLDDLDRLETQEILDSFKLIRTLSDFNNIIFIAGYNRDYIVKMCGADKKDYIHKIFQVEINLLPFDEKRLREVILEEVRTAFPISNDDSLNHKLFQGFNGLFDNTQNYIPKIEDLLMEYDENPRDIISLNWFRFLVTYRDIKRFINEFKFNYIFINEHDIIAKEYILLKLLLFKYRELQQTIFLNLEDVLSNFVVDVVNDKLQPTNFGYGGVFVYDDQSYKRLTAKLHKYPKDDIELIDAVFSSLFGAKQINYYTSNQNSIAQIYHTNTYVRNNIAGAVYKISDFRKAYEELNLGKLIDEIENYTPQTKSQVLNELKRFLLNQEIQNKNQFVDYFGAINRFFGQNNIIDDQKIINKIDKSLKDLYKGDKQKLIESLKGCLYISKIGYLDRLLSDININEKRKDRPDIYLADNIIDYQNVIFDDHKLKDILVGKLKFIINSTSQTNLIIECYQLHVEFIAADHKIIKAAIANDLVLKDIKARFLYYFWTHIFDFYESSGGSAFVEYREYAPKFYLCQIFAKPSTLKKLIKTPKDKTLFLQYEKEGWDNYYKYLKSVKKLDAYSGEFTLARLEKIKKLMEEFIKNGYKPLINEEYIKIWDL